MHEVRSDTGDTFLVSMPTKFRWKENFIPISITVAILKSQKERLDQAWRLCGGEAHRRRGQGEGGDLDNLVQGADQVHQGREPVACWL